MTGRAMIIMATRYMELFILSQVPSGITIIPPLTGPFRVVTMTFLHFSGEDNKGHTLRNLVSTRETRGLVVLILLSGFCYMETYKILKKEVVYVKSKSLGRKFRNNTLARSPVQSLASEREGEEIKKTVS